MTVRFRSQSSGQQWQKALTFLVSCFVIVDSVTIPPTCRWPSTVANGHIVQETRGISVVCNDGFGIFRSGTIFQSVVVECLPSGAWSGSFPSCQPKPCPNLKSLENGALNSASGFTGSTTTFSCDSGYVLHGSSVITCLPSGSWSSTPPICRKSSCPDIRAIPHGSLTLSSGNFGDVVTFTCDPNYELQGAGELQCSASGWNGNIPACVPCQEGEVSIGDSSKCVPHPECVDFSVSQNGNMVRTSLYTRKILCDEGYHVHFQGADTAKRDVIVTCSEVGQWTPGVPQCEKFECPEVTPPTNGFLTLTRATLGQTSRVTCQEGYSIQGPSELYCTEKGWSNPVSTCQPNQCIDLETPERAHMHVDGVTGRTGDIRTFSCDPGFRISGSTSSSTICLPDSSWSSQYYNLTCDEEAKPEPASENDPTILDTCGWYYCRIGVLVAAGLLLILLLAVTCLCCKRRKKQGSATITDENPAYDNESDAEANDEPQRGNQAQQNLYPMMPVNTDERPPPSYTPAGRYGNDGVRVPYPDNVQQGHNPVQVLPQNFPSAPRHPVLGVTQSVSTS